jgi:tetratricopeptide (TPR) repeat protein
MLKDAMGSYRGTAEEISRIINAQPANAEAYFNRANALSSTGDYEGAVRDYTMALKIGLRFREAITALGNRGIARTGIGDSNGALADFSEIIARKPKNGRLLHAAYQNRAAVKEQQGNRDGAAEDRKMASMLKPETTT